MKYTYLNLTERGKNMHISNIKIKNYRNLEYINISIGKLVVLIGENNSGKSNLLRAITLPFLNDDVGNINKTLAWEDINKKSRDKYFEFLIEHYDEISDGLMEVNEFSKKLPEVIVELELSPNPGEEYYVKNWIVKKSEEDKFTYKIRYVYKVKDVSALYDHVKNILPTEKSEINEIQMNLLPIHFFQYFIVVPETEVSVSFTDLNNFKYNSLIAERDDFSYRNTQLGSKSLVTLLNNKLNDDDKIHIERSYGAFFDSLKNISDVENLINWHETSELKNTEDFFEKITLMPNMPSMNSLLNNVKLGYGDEYLYSQGLGFKNLIYLLVMINSMESNDQSIYRMLTIEEPEAHLSFGNKKLLASFINSMLTEESNLQLFISTHSTEFINKLDLKNITVVNGGNAFSLLSDMNDSERDYLAKKPNLDFLKFLFSRSCILVEGPTEEMLIKTYLHNRKDILNDIEVISLHKGFSKMIELWLRVNKNSPHKLGIIRDYDNQEKAKLNHEKYNTESNIKVATTQHYTLEDEIVHEANNYSILKNYFEVNYSWSNIDTPEKLSEEWKGAKTDVMLKFCQSMGDEHLKDLVLPKHISTVLDFFIEEVKE